jgi:transposase-like protein
MVDQFRNRPLKESYPYVWVDALYVKVIQNHRFVTLPLVIAVGVDEDGERHLLGFDLGGSEDEAFWLSFFRSLVSRGVKDVQLMISDANEGLKKALSKVFPGAAWQRCRVHFMRNLLARIPHRDKTPVAEAVRLVFEQPSHQSAVYRLRKLVELLDRTYPDAARILADAEQDILAYKTFPKEHWRRIHSTNMIERINKEVKRRYNVMGFLPDRPSVFRVIGPLLKELDDNWRASQRRYFSQKSMLLVTEPDIEDDPQASALLVELTTNIDTEAQINLHH